MAAPTMITLATPMITPEQRQKAAQLVRADGIHRQAERVLKLMPGAGQPRTAIGTICLPG